MSSAVPDSSEISISELEVNAATVAECFMESAEVSIDTQFGSGYAAKHPVLVAGLIQACVGVYQADSLRRALARLGDDFQLLSPDLRLKHIADWLHELTDAVRDGAKGSLG